MDCAEIDCINGASQIAKDDTAQAVDVRSGGLHSRMRLRAAAESELKRGR